MEKCGFSLDYKKKLLLLIHRAQKQKKKIDKKAENKCNGCGYIRYIYVYVYIK